MTDRALDALLAEYVAPPVPAGLAGRVAAAALALPQEPRLPYFRRASRDRRGSWLRRPMIIGGLAVGLAVSGAVAATLAGVRLDRLPVVEAVLARLPFTGVEAPPETAPRPAQVPSPSPAAPVRESPAASLVEVEPPAPRPVAVPDDPSPVPAAADAPPRSEAAEPRLVEPQPPAMPLPPPVAREERIVSTPALEPRIPAPGANEEARLRQERIERAERLRAARQAQIERLQRIQQRRERIRRLRRD